MSEKIRNGYKMVTIGKKGAFQGRKAEAVNLLIFLVPEVWHITNRTHLRDLNEKWFMTYTFKWP